MASLAVSCCQTMLIRPLQNCLYDWVLRWSFVACTSWLLHEVLSHFNPWKDNCFYGRFASRSVSKSTVQTTDGSRIGWGASCNRCAALGTCSVLIDCPKVVISAFFLGEVLTIDPGQAHANPGHNSPVNPSWSQQELRFLQSTHILCDLIHAVESFLWQVSHWDEWRLHPQKVQLIGVIQSSTDTSVASQDFSLCPLWFPV